MRIKATRRAFYKGRRYFAGDILEYDSEVAPDWAAPAPGAEITERKSVTAPRPEAEGDSEPDAKKTAAK